jgi:hypothetical protein
MGTTPEAVTEALRRICCVGVVYANLRNDTERLRRGLAKKRRFSWTDHLLMNIVLFLEKLCWTYATSVASLLPLLLDECLVEGGAGASDGGLVTWLIRPTQRLVDEFSGRMVKAGSFLKQLLSVDREVAGGLAASQVLNLASSFAKDCFSASEQQVAVGLVKYAADGFFR